MWQIALTLSAIALGCRAFAILLWQHLLGRVQGERIVLEEITQEQQHRENVWSVGLVLDGFFLGLFIYLGIFPIDPGPFWLCLLVMILSYICMCEPIYYGIHRLFHNGSLFWRHHLYHHKSLILEPITSMSFTFTERCVMLAIFVIPPLVANGLHLFDFRAYLLFYILFDGLNCLAHSNLKMETPLYKNSILKWLIYSPEFHERHHRLSRVNFALFMPIFDKLFGTY